MINPALTIANAPSGRRSRGMRALTFWFLSAALAAIVGCGTANSAKKKEDFFTSGSREADQRASQRMAKQEQLSGSGEGAGEKDVKKATPGPTGKAEGRKPA